jgi:predicted secreted protein
MTFACPNTQSKAGRPILMTAARILLLVATLSPLAHAEGAPAVDFSVEAQTVAENDLARATIYAEVTHSSAAEAARQVNVRIADAMAKAKRAGISTRSEQARTYPIYAKGGQRIDAWRVRSELSLESEAIETLSVLIGDLQESVAVSSLTLSPKPETQRLAADRAIDAGLALWQARAARIAKALGKSYRIANIQIDDQIQPPGVLRARSAAMMMADSAPMPIESGESKVSITVRGKIELID